MSIWRRSFIPKTSDNSKKRGSFSALFLVLLVLFAVSLFAGILFGSVRVDFSSALSSLWTGQMQNPSLRILLYLRLPRVLAGALAGMGLAVAGVLIQAVLHNPMAAPNVIGVNSGAGLGAIFMLAVFPSAVSVLPLAAFFGAVLTCLCIYAISMKTGADRMTVTLVGIAVSSMLNAGINTVKTLYPDSVYDADSFMIGGLSGVTFARILPAGVLIVLGVLVALFFGLDVDVLSLGDDTAKSLGMNVRGMQLLLLSLASVLAGAAVSFAGLLGFVGLIVPHISRKLVGNHHRKLIPVSALGGGILVLLCDLLSRVLFAPYELPVGILLSFVGGPFFIGLILWGRKRYD